MLVNCPMLVVGINTKSGCGHRGACNSQKPIAVAEVL